MSGTTGPPTRQTLLMRTGGAGTTFGASGTDYNTTFGIFQISQTVNAKAENDNDILPGGLPWPARDGFAYLNNTLINHGFGKSKGATCTIDMKATGPCRKHMHRHYKIYESPWVVQ